MPFISSDNVKAIRTELKATFPELKFSVTRKHHNSVDIKILTGNLPEIPEGYNQVNQYHIPEHYKDQPEWKDVLIKVDEIAERKNGVLVVDSDYGTVPNYYVDISIGEWDKPYRQYVKPENSVKETYGLMLEGMKERGERNG